MAPGASNLDAAACQARLAAVAATLALSAGAASATTYVFASSGFVGQGPAFQTQPTSIRLSKPPTTGFGQNYAFRVSGVVPEPAAWGMLIQGFGAIRSSLRKRPRRFS